MLINTEGFTLYKTWEAGDGWMDSFKVVWAVVEDKRGNLYKLHWHEGNEEFFANLPSGGSCPLRLHDAILKTPDGEVS